MGGCASIFFFEFLPENVGLGAKIIFMQTFLR